MPKLMRELDIQDGDFCVNDDTDALCKYLDGRSDQYAYSEAYLVCPIFDVDKFQIDKDSNGDERVHKCDECKFECAKAEHEAEQEKEIT